MIGRIVESAWAVYLGALIGALYCGARWWALAGLIAIAVSNAFVDAKRHQRRETDRVRQAIDAFGANVIAAALETLKPGDRDAFADRLKGLVDLDAEREAALTKGRR